MAKQIAEHRPEVLEGAPMRYAPQSELGVVFLFSRLAKKLRLRVDTVQSGFPDCVAYQKSHGKENKIRIEFEFKAKNFKMHRHDPKGCDWIVCWENNWPDAPKRLHMHGAATDQFLARPQRRHTARAYLPAGRAASAARGERSRAAGPGADAGHPHAGGRLLGAGTPAHA